MAARLISELRRRNVLRMAVLYAAAAWVLAQIAEVASELVGLPEQSGKTLLIVLIIGFPIALILSWFYELTPEGVILDKDLEAFRPITQFGGRRVDFVIIAVLSAALFLVAYDKWWETGPDDHSIAVLPFHNMSNDPEQEYFSDGISEEILNLLAQIRPLKVKARTSSFWFKGKEADIATIAEKLEVRYILEGSVRHDGNRVRITAQLIDVEDGSHLWSQTYDRNLSAASLFHVQSEVARAISSQLKITLTEPQEQRLAKVPTQNTEAYAAYLIGRQRLTDRRVDWIEDAVEHFARSIELDANFAGAYSGLFDACFLYEAQSGGHQHERCPPDPEALRQLAEKAVELDENLGEAWISLGAALDGEEAYKAFERGLSLNPSYIQGYLWYASTLSSPSQYDSWDDWLDAWEADTWQSIIKRGLTVDPLSILLHSRLSDHPMWARTKEEAFYHAHRVIEIAPDSPRGYAIVGTVSWHLLGRIDESIRWAHKALEIDPRRPRYAMQIAYAYATLGDIDIAMAYWERAAQLIADEASFSNIHILRAQILLSDKDGIPLQKVFDALEPVDTGEVRRLEIEANLAMINGEAEVWLNRHIEYLSTCLNAPIDVAYLNRWPECGIWLDGLLQATGEDARAHAAVKERIPWDQKWTLWGDRAGYGDPRNFVILGEKEKALDSIEEYLENYRGNPYVGRLYLAENLRFILYHDPMLDPIRDHPRFQALVAEIEADMAQQLETVRAMQRAGELPTLEELRAKLGTD